MKKIVLMGLLGLGMMAFATGCEERGINSPDAQKTPAQAKCQAGKCQAGKCGGNSK